MKAIDQLLLVAEVYCAAAGIAEATLSTRVMNDGKGFRSLRGGADITTRKHDAALNWLSTHWPEGAVWPEGVPRPAAPAALVGAARRLGGTADGREA